MLPKDLGPWLPTPAVAKRYNKSTKTIKRWREDPELNFPPTLDINGHPHNSLPQLVQWEHDRIENLKASAA